MIDYYGSDIESREKFPSGAAGCEFYRIRRKHVFKEIMRSLSTIACNMLLLQIQTFFTIVYVKWMFVSLLKTCSGLRPPKKS